MTNVSYHMPGINGYGSALSTDINEAQFVEIPTYRNLSYRSFTVEMWFYLTDLDYDDHGLFGQHEASATCQSLHLIVRNTQLRMGFYGDDLPGSTYLTTNKWYHAAFVYDYSLSTQYIYLNGYLDSNRASSSYKGMSGSITIGMTQQDSVHQFYFPG